MPALRGIDLDVAPGAFVALMGPVGAGKSTLCLALNGAIPHVVEGDLDGAVVVCGQDTRDVSMGQLAAQVGLVLEDVEAQLFNASVADEVAFGLEGLGLPPAEIEARIGPALELVGLAGLEQRVPRTLSGGQQKRLALAGCAGDAARASWCSTNPPPGWIRAAGTRCWPPSTACVERANGG